MLLHSIVISVFAFQSVLSQTCTNGFIWIDTCVPCPMNCNGEEVACTLDCKQGCGCPAGSFLDDEKNCVPADKCPPRTCPAGEELYLADCAPCDELCSNINDATHICTKDCQQNVCRCKKGYVRNAKKACVLAAECPKMCDTADEIYNQNICLADYPCGPATTCKEYRSGRNAFIMCKMMCLLGDRCSCKEGHVKNDEGVCIPQDDCPIPTCEVGETFFTESCAPCKKTCANVYNPDYLCTKECATNVCRCSIGYVRDENNVCVKEEECKADLCGAGEVFYSGDGCLPCERSCDNWYQDQVACTADCKLKSCMCKSGYVRNVAGVCVETKECPAPECPPDSGMVWYESPNCLPCNTTCSGEQECPLTDDCKFGCACPKDLVLDASGKCTAQADCPKTCTKGFIWIDTCVPCPMNCNGEELTCTLDCKQGCGCPAGSFLDDEKNCVPADKCPPRTCPAEEELYLADCAPCDELCSNINDASHICTKDCQQNVCRCKDGYVRNAKKACVLATDCPKMCDTPDEIYNQNICLANYPCGPATTCEQYRSGRSAHIMCLFLMCILGDRCSCKEGHVKNDEGVCIPEEDCPIPTCEVGETFFAESCAPCKKTCPNVYNSNYLCTEECATNVCRCSEGYVRNENNVCVKEEECKADLCGAGEVFYSGDDCLPCERSCDNWYKDQVACTADCKLKSCTCKSGYVRNGAGVCVETKECPAPVCGSGEKFYPEGECLPCEGVCTGEQICTRECKFNVCGCVEGQKRLNSDTCVGTC